MTIPVFSYLLLKVASLCNLNCTYCYWFRDNSVYTKPKVLSEDVEAAFLAKLEEHVKRHELKTFWILLHGGEPMLFGKARFVRLLDAIDGIGTRTDCKFDISMTTNGVLIDEEWTQLFAYYGVSLTISIDGTPDIHNKHRIDHAGKGSHSRVIRGLNLLRREQIDVGVLAVCDPESDPEAVTRYFVDELQLQHFDILVPDATHEDAPHSIAPYYQKLFDLWYDEYSKQGIAIRYPKGLLTGILGGKSYLESIGYGPIQTLTMLTDGSLEPLDVLRIAGDSSTKTDLNIQTHTFQDITSDPRWLQAYQASLNLHDTCRACEYHHACGGGFLPHRWSHERQYNNPSVYCKDLKSIFGHIWSKITPDLRVVEGETTIPFMIALEQAKSTPK